MRTVTVKCLHCGHTKTLTVKEVKGFKCKNCGHKGTVINDVPSNTQADSQMLCCVCAEELDAKNMRQINGRIYCVKHASDIDRKNKRSNSIQWNDYKGATSWGKHD